MAQVPAARTSPSGGLAARREHPLRRMGRDFDTLLDRLWGGFLAPFDPDLEPLRLWDFGVSENDREVAVRAEIPGFEPNELDVQINNDVLTIKAEKEQKGEGREEYRSFYRSVRLPPGLDAEHAKADCRNGVLELHIPRAEGAAPKRIEVQGRQDASGRQGPQAQAKPGNGAGSQGSDPGRQADKAEATTSGKAKK
jgi:HSP20 family protein